MNERQSGHIEQADFNLLEIPYDAVIRKDNKHAGIIAKILHNNLKSKTFKQEPKTLIQQYINKNP